MAALAELTEPLAACSIEEEQVVAHKADADRLTDAAGKILRRLDGQHRAIDPVVARRTGAAVGLIFLIIDYKPRCERRSRSGES